EFDAAESEWIAITFRYDPANPSADPAQEIADVVLALDQYDRSLGGCGLVLDSARSATSKEQVYLIVRPVESKGAAERFRQMAQVLGCPLEQGPLQPRAPRSDGGLPETIG